MAEEPQVGWPGEVRAEFDELWQSVVGLHAMWKLYCGLFAGDGNVEVLRETANAAFQLIEQAIRHDMTMAIGRLLDKAQTGGKQNMSLARLVESLRPHLPATEHERTVEALEGVRRSAEPFLHARNRRIAHRDLSAALRPEDYPLPDIGRSMVDDVLAGLARCLNTLDRRFTGNETFFGSPIQFGNGNDLVEILRQHLRGRAESAKRRLGFVPPRLAKWYCPESSDTTIDRSDSSEAAGLRH